MIKLVFRQNLSDKQQSKCAKEFKVHLRNLKGRKWTYRIWVHVYFIKLPHKHQKKVSRKEKFPLPVDLGFLFHILNFHSFFNFIIFLRKNFLEISI